MNKTTKLDQALNGLKIRTKQIKKAVDKAAQEGLPLKDLERRKAVVMDLEHAHAMAESHLAQQNKYKVFLVDLYEQTNGLFHSDGKFTTAPGLRLTLHQDTELRNRIKRMKALYDEIQEDLQ